MAKYTINYTCGHSSVVNLIGPHRSREQRIAHLESGVCFECYKHAAHTAAQAQAEDLELPALVGSEKQIAWAEPLRIQKLTEIEAYVERLEQETEEEAYRQALQVVERISNETSAKQWIEWRHDLPRRILAEVFRQMQAEPTEEERQKQRAAQKQAEGIRRAALVEATIRPVSPVSEIAAEIHLRERTISLSFAERRDDFRLLAKSFGYVWEDGTWQRTIDAFAGDPVDRVVEIGCALLSRGFLVRIFDDALRARVVAGEFTPEHTRWIVTLQSEKYAGWFAFKWGRNEDYYRAARALKGSRYCSPFVVVPASEVEQVLDFARLHDFRLSKTAQEVAQAAQEDRARMLTVEVEPVPLPRKHVASTIPPQLAVPETVEIDAELRD